MNPSQTTQPDPTEINELGQPIGVALPNWKQPEWPSREPMEGRFCRLEALNPGLHAESLHAANSIDAEGRMWTYMGYGPFSSFEAYVKWMEPLCLTKDPVFYAIIDRQSDRAVGVASYLRIDPSVGCIEVGHLAYSPLLQRTPTATEAMYLMMERAFKQGYRRYEWKCHSMNAASRSAALRLGFTYEGLFRQATIMKGRNRDTAWFSIIDQEWPALQGAFQNWLSPDNYDAEGKQRVRLSDFIAQIASNG